MSKQAAPVNLWNEEDKAAQGQVEIGCGICGLTASELSSVDPYSGDSVVDQRSLALPCEECDGDFHQHQTCEYCGGDASVQCGECNGDGQFDCSTCSGDGAVECAECEGSGEDPYDPEEFCQTCNGDGKYDCPGCEGTGEGSECEYCSGYGEYECYECSGYGSVDCSECEENGYSELVGLEEWCVYWEQRFGGSPNVDLNEQYYYPWTGFHRPNIVWSDHCLAYGADQDDLGLEVQKVGANKGVWAYKSSNSREASKASNAWEEEIRDDPQLFPNFICPECEEPSFLYSIGYDAGAPVFISACPNNHETILTEFQMEEWTIETQPVEDAIESVDWDQLVEDESLLNEINKAVSNRKTSNTANAWTEERNPDQLRLVGCPNCGSDELMAHFEDGAIFAGCADCGEYFNYAEEYDQWSGKREPGYPTVVEDTLTNGDIYHGPTESTSFESEILSLVSGRDNEFFNEEAADQLYEWARLTNTLPELKDAAQTVSEEAATEIDNWSIEGIHFDPTYISAPMIEDMEDEEFLETFGEDKTREEAMNESNEAYQWYWDENANNHGAFKAAQHILDYFKEPTF